MLRGNNLNFKSEIKILDKDHDAVIECMLEKSVHSPRPGQLLPFVDK